MDEYFDKFDKDGDDKLSMEEFAVLCSDLLCNAKNEPYSLTPEKLEEIFAVFDKDQDKFISREEFKLCYGSWIERILHPTNAFLIIDVQNDFISGSFSSIKAIHNLEEVVEPINNILDTTKFDAVLYSLDWHPENHISFIENVKQRPMDPTSLIDADSAKVGDLAVFTGENFAVEQILWPRHCQQDTWGAELHKDLKFVDDGIKILKGTNPGIDSYSAFWDNKKYSCTELIDILKEKNITDVFICGIAYDFCVGYSALHSLEEGFRTILIDDCSRGITTEGMEKMKEDFVANGGLMVQSNEIKPMLDGSDRRPELAYKLAKELKNKVDIE